MAEAHLARLHLDLSRARTATDFLESYANTTGRELENFQEGTLRSRLAADRTEQADILWTLTMDMASALREAASWATYFDVDRAFGLLQRAGFLYQSAGLAFGSFLLTIAGSPPTDEFSRDAALLAQLHGEAGSSDLGEIPSALYHPQQQAYLLLAYAGMADSLLRSQREDGPSGALDNRRSLHSIAERSPNRQGVLPFGALGTPVRVVWDIGVRLLEPTGENPESVDVVARHLIRLCSRYGEMMDLARVNDYLWDNGAAPVDVGDIDVMGITALCTSHFGFGEMTEAVVRGGLDSSSVSFIPFDLGREMAELSARRFGI